MQTRRKRNGELNLPSVLLYPQETNVLMGAAQEDIQRQVKGRLTTFTVQCAFARMPLMEVVQKIRVFLAEGL